MLFDSHAHYDDERFEPDRDEVLQAAFQAGVGLILNAASSIKSSSQCIELAEKYDFIHASIGVHPHEAVSMQEQDMGLLARMASARKVVAVGEIGLDYHYDFSPREEQKYWFARQIDLAKSLKLPVIIHDRDAHEDVLNIVKNEGAGQVGGIFHCYSGSVEMAREVLNQNFFISIAGPVTFKNAKKLVEIVKFLPLDRMLIETDCPYLTPEPFRGKRNHSGYVGLVAARIAEIKGMEPEQIAEITTRNARNLLKI